MKNSIFITLSALFFTAGSLVAQEAPNTPEKSFIEEIQEWQRTNELAIAKANRTIENSCDLTAHVRNFVQGILNPMKRNGMIGEAYRTYQRCRNAKHNLAIEEKVAREIAAYIEQYDTLEIPEEWQVARDLATCEKINALLNQRRAEPLSEKFWIQKA